MSRQSKQIRKAAIKKQITAMHKDGNKGPSGTQPKHGKVKTWSKMGRKPLNKAS